MDEKNQIMVAPSASEISTFFDRGRLEEMWGLANKFHQSGAFTKDCTSPAAALVKMQAGFEMGMAPMEAMNSLYIVNGHVTIFGMAMVRRLRKFGWEISYDDKPGSCTVTIKKGDQVKSYTATKEEVMKGKAWTFAPKEKLRYHAISRLIRFEIPEVLDAGVTYLKEEAEDFEPSGIQVLDASGIGVKTQSVDEIILAIQEAATLQEMQAIVSKVDKLSGPDQEKVKEAIIAKRQFFLKKDFIKAKEVHEAGVKMADQFGTKVGVDMAKPGAEQTVKTIVNQETGEIEGTYEEKGNYIDGEVVEQPRAHKAIKNDYWNFDKVATTLAGLKTNKEVVGFKDEMVRLFNDGEITDAIYKHAITESQRRLNQITKLSREENGQDSLLPN